MFFPSFPLSLTGSLRHFSKLLLLASSSPSLPLQPLPGVFSIKSGEMSSTKTLNISGGKIFVTSLNASCSTMRRSKQLHFDPGKMAVMVWSGSATHRSNSTHPLVLGVPAQHSRDLPWEAEVRSSRPTPQGRLTRSKAFSKSQNQGYCSLIFFSLAQYFNPFISIQVSSDCPLSSSISAISGVPINTILLLPLRHFWCSQMLPTNVSTSASAQSVSHA